jgi:O-antigen/teichoic acid export membrane protein
MRSFLRGDAIARPAVLLVIGRTIGFALSFAIPVVLARVLGLADFGTYKQIFLIWTTVFGLAQLGFAESLYYFLPHRPELGGRYVANAVLSLTALGGLAIALLIALAPALGGWLDNAWLSEHLWLLGVFVALTLISAVFEIVLISRQRYLGAAVAYAASDVLKMICIVAPVVMLGGLDWVLPGAVAFAGLRVGWMAWQLWRELGPSLRPDLTLWREQVAYALPFALAVSLEVVQANLHQYVVAARVDAAAFAIYAVGCLQIPLVDVVAISTGNVLMVKMAEARGDKPAALSLWHDTICRIALVIFPLTAFLLIAAREIIVTLFTASYLPSVPVFTLWSLTILPSVFCVDAVLRVYAQTRFLLIMNVARLAIVGSLIVWCLSAFGLNGAVIVVLIATVLSRLMGIVRIASLLDAPLRDALPYGRLAAIAGCAVAASPLAIWALASATWPRPLALVWSAAVYATGYAMAGYGSWRLRGGSPAALPRLRPLAWWVKG